MLWLSHAETRSTGTTGITQFEKRTSAVAQPRRNTGHSNRHRALPKAHICCGSAAQEHESQEQEASRNLRSIHLLWLSRAGARVTNRAGTRVVKFQREMIGYRFQNMGSAKASGQHLAVYSSAVLARNMKSSIVYVQVCSVARAHVQVQMDGNHDMLFWHFSCSSGLLEPCCFDRER